MKFILVIFFSQCSLFHLLQLWFLQTWFLYFPNVLTLYEGEEVLVTSTLEINRDVGMILVLAQQTFLQQKSVEQPTFLLLLHKNAAAHPPSFAEEILLGYQLWKIKGIWTLILNFPMRGRIVASAAFGSCEKAYKYRSLD